MIFILTRIAEVTVDFRWRLCYAMPGKTLMDVAGKRGLVTLSIDPYFSRFFSNDL